MYIRAINPLRDVDAVENIASIYREAFGNDPWNEGYVCPICETVFPLSYRDATCSLCAQKSFNVLVAEYWPISKVVSDFYHEMRKPDPVCVVLRDEVIIGFAWGYTVQIDRDLGVHLEAPGLHERIDGTFFYLDECAIAPPYQMRGLGKMLIQRIHQEQRVGRMLLRTLNNSRMCTLVTHIGGAIVQNISRERVVMTLEA